MHTGREGMSAMPYFDDFDLSTVDILLISQYVSPFSTQLCYLPTPLSDIEETPRKKGLEVPCLGHKLDLQIQISIVSIAQSTNTILFTTKRICSLKSPAARKPLDKLLCRL